MRLAVLNAVTAACFFIAAPLPESGRLILSAVSLVLLVIASIVMLQRADVFSAIDEEHLLERMGAFTLIVCGEAFVEIAISVSDATIDTVNIAALIRHDRDEAREWSTRDKAVYANRRAEAACRLFRLLARRAWRFFRESVEEFL